MSEPGVRRAARVFPCLALSLSPALVLRVTVLPVWGHTLSVILEHYTHGIQILLWAFLVVRSLLATSRILNGQSNILLNTVRRMRVRTGDGPCAVASGRLTDLMRVSCQV